jgi:MFS family permease
VQIGSGIFVAFYLADLGWSKESVGLALATGQIAGVLGQIPGGAIADAIFWKRSFARRRPQR